MKPSSRTRRRCAAVLALGVLAAACTPASGPATTTTTTAAPGPGAGVVLEGGAAPGEYTDGVGAFRTVCTQSHMLADDPLVHPGHPGMSHLHSFFGNTGTWAGSDTASLLAGGTTCPGGTANRTAYWVPAMVDAGTPVPARRVVSYYKSGYAGVEPHQVRALPRGLRMVAGEPSRTTEDLRPAWERHTSWSCIRVPEGDFTASTKEMPVCPPGWDVVMTVRFPQCWDGVHLDAADHRSHMAYADGGCPATHPVPLAEVTENVYWPNPSGNASWRLTSDLYDGPAGRSAHADWWNGWDPGVMALWLSHCVAAGLDCRAEDLGDGRRLAGG